MIDRTTKDYKLMAERYGNEMADELCKLSEEKAQAQAESDKQRKQFEMNEDKRIRECYGDDMADIFNKLEKEGNSRYSDLFGKSNYSLDGDMTDAVKDGNAKKEYERIRDTYMPDILKLYDKIETATGISKKTLEPMNSDPKYLALTIAMYAMNERYAEYLKQDKK